MNEISQIQSSKSITVRSRLNSNLIPTIMSPPTKQIDPFKFPKIESTGKGIQEMAKISEDENEETPNLQKKSQMTFGKLDGKQKISEKSQKSIEENFTKKKKEFLKKKKKLEYGTPSKPIDTMEDEASPLNLNTSRDAIPNQLPIEKKKRRISLVKIGSINSIDKPSKKFENFNEDFREKNEEKISKNFGAKKSYEVGADEDDGSSRSPYDEKYRSITEIMKNQQKKNFMKKQSLEKFRDNGGRALRKDPIRSPQDSNHQ